MGVYRQNCWRDFPSMESPSWDQGFHRWKDFDVLTKTIMEKFSVDGRFVRYSIDGNIFSRVQFPSTENSHTHIYIYIYIPSMERFRWPNKNSSGQISVDGKICWDGMRYSIDGNNGGGGVLWVHVEVVDILCTCNPNQNISDRKHTKNIFSRSSHHKYSILQIFWCFHRWNTLLHSDKILNLFVTSNNNLHSHTALSIDGNHIFRILMLFQILIWQFHVFRTRVRRVWGT